MDSKETKEFVTVMMANVLSDTSVLAPHVAREFAERVMAELLAAEYLITNGEIFSVMETSGTGNGDDECDAWEVYTHAEPYDDEEDDGTDEHEEMAEGERQAKRDADDAGLE